MKSKSRFKLGRHATEELFSLVHRTLAIAQEMDDQPRMEVIIGHSGELGFIPHNEAGAEAVHLIQKWVGSELGRIAPGDSIWFSKGYPFINERQAGAESGDQPDIERAGSPLPRSEPPGRKSYGLNEWRRKEKDPLSPSSP